MPTYTVKWTIQIDAESHEGAAKEALTIMRDPKSTATVFEVEEFDKQAAETQTIDISG